MKHDSRFHVRTILTTISLSSVLILAGCGGGGGTASTPAATAPTASLVGSFTDAPVAGAEYVTSSGSGGCVASAPCTTNAQGQFNYASGDTVAFMAAGVTLGTTPALQPSADGTTTVTPVNLVAGATAPTDPGPTAIAQFLQTLNTITAGTSGSGSAGVLTMPPDSATTSTLTTALAGAGVTATSSITSVVSQLQTAINSAFGANKFTVVPAATAQAALTQGVNSDGIVGTVWTGTCTCGGGGTIYFQPGGTLTGFTADGSLLAGSWAGATTSGSGVSVQASSSGGGYGTGTIPANSNTATVTVYDSSGAQKGTIAFNKIVAASASAVSNSQYLGGWYATFTPNAAGLAAGNTGGTAYIIAAPDGTFYGITDGSNQSFQGTWTIANGQGSASWTDTGSGNSISISIDLANANGTVSINGAAAGTLSFSRTGVLTRKNNQSSSGSPIPLLLNVAVSWANAGNTVDSFALALNIYDSNGNLVASGVKSESTAPSSTGIRTTTTDNIAVSYPTGGAATYSLSVGPANCTITGGSGSINDANSGNAGAYPTVYVTCDAGATATAAPPIPLLLNVVTSWGTTYPSPGYGLSLQVMDANGNQIANGFVQQNVNLATGTNGAVVGTTTTDNIAASYPKGGGVSYVLSTGSGPGAYCSITSGGSGSVNDANSGNAGAYATVNVSCP
jgi:hypothetical protein